MSTKAATVAKPRRAEPGYIFKPFNAETFSATKVAWEKDAKAGEGFGPEIEQLMGWVQDHITLTGNEMAYGVFFERKKEAVGICELAITKPSARGKWVKLIRLRLRPEVERQIFENNPDGTTVALRAYVAAVLGVYHVKNQHEATTIKIYGRTQEQVRFLTLLAIELNKQKAASFATEIEGRWLTLNWGKK